MTKSDQLWSCMSDGLWWTLDELCYEVKMGESSLSATIRNWRKDKYGGFTVERKYATLDRRYEYRLRVI